MLTENVNYHDCANGNKHYHALHKMCAHTGSQYSFSCLLWEQTNNGWIPIVDSICYCHSVCSFNAPQLWAATAASKGSKLKVPNGFGRTGRHCLRLASWRLGCRYARHILYKPFLRAFPQIGNHRDWCHGYHMILTELYSWLMNLFKVGPNCQNSNTSLKTCI